METRRTKTREFAVQHGGAGAAVVESIIYLFEQDQESVHITTLPHSYKRDPLTSKISPEIRHEFAIVYVAPLRVRQSIRTGEECTYHSKVPRPVFSPVAHTVENRATRGIERHAHVVVTFIGDERCTGTALVVAVVVFCATKPHCQVCDISQKTWSRIEGGLRGKNLLR